MADGGLKEVTRRDVLKLGGLALGGALLAACGIKPKEDPNLPEGYFSDIEKGSNVWLSIEGEENEKKLVTIRYNENVSPLATRGDVKTGEGKEVSCQIQEFVNGRETRRQTGEILESNLYELKIHPDAEWVGVWINPWPGQSESERKRKLEQGEKVIGIPVATCLVEDAWPGEEDYEINTFRPGGRPNPEKFAKGWAVGMLVNELDNPHQVFKVQGYVFSHEVLVPTSD